MQENRIQSVSWEDPLGMGMTTHSNSRAWKNPWRCLAVYSPWGHKSWKQLWRLCTHVHKTWKQWLIAGIAWITNVWSSGPRNVKFWKLIFCHRRMERFNHRNHNSLSLSKFKAPCYALFLSVMLKKWWVTFGMLTWQKLWKYHTNNWSLGMFDLREATESDLCVIGGNCFIHLLIHLTNAESVFIWMLGVCK